MVLAFVDGVGDASAIRRCAASSSLFLGLPLGLVGIDS